MIAGIFYLGSWKSLDEAEDSITMRELQLLMNARNKEVERNQRFQAALKGIDLKENSDENSSAFDDIQAQANAINAGKTAEDAEQHKEDTFLTDAGIDVVTL